MTAVVTLATRSDEPAAGAGARRPALDGVRALAVLAVLVYHFGGGSTSWLPGGFLGVDVFFVLSGYLITGLLLREHATTGRIDLVGFWVRRARRLVPALIPVLLVVCGWIWWATPLESYPDRREDIFWTVGYLANWHLIGSSDDYFAAYTTASPLRHAWSLAIEEQFYLVWPLLLMLLLSALQRLPISRIRSAALPALVTIGIGLSAWTLAATYDPQFPAAAYYATLARVHELLVGVLLAVFFARQHRAGARSVRGAPTAVLVLAPAALLALAAAILLVSDTGEFYYHGGSLAVSLVVAGVIAVLELSPRSWVARAFSWRPAAALGRISYGIYLWHWPLVLIIPITAEQSGGEQIGRQVARVVLTVVLAAASYRFVEQPVQRDRRILTSRPRVLLAVLASSALVLAVAVPATALPGTLAEQMAVRSDRSCPGGERYDLLISCTMPIGADAVQNPPELALLGDSIARALGPGLDKWAAETDNTWIKAAWRRCPSTGLIAVSVRDPEPDLAAISCHEQAPGLIRETLRTYRPAVVLIYETWTSDHPVLVEGVPADPGSPAHDAAVVTGYQRLVDEIDSFGGKAVFVELPPVGDTIGAQFATGRPAGRSRPTALDRSAVNRHNGLLREVVASRPDAAELISITDVLCPDGPCPAVIDGVLLRKDGTHFTVGYSEQLVPVLTRRIGLP